MTRLEVLQMLVEAEKIGQDYFLAEWEENEGVKTTVKVNGMGSEFARGYTTNVLLIVAELSNPVYKTTVLRLAA